MPEIDFAILADHVRAENGLGYVIAGGIDRVVLPAVPGGLQAGVLMRLKVTPGEHDRPHRVDFIFQDTDGLRLMQMNAVAEFPPDADALMLAVNFGLPIPHYGRYSLEIVINDTSHKSIDVTAVSPNELSAT